MIHYYCFDVSSFAIPPCESVVGCFRNRVDFSSGLQLSYGWHAITQSSFIQALVYVHASKMLSLAFLQLTVQIQKLNVQVTYRNLYTVLFQVYKSTSQQQPQMTVATCPLRTHRQERHHSIPVPVVYHP